MQTNTGSTQQLPSMRRALHKGNYLEQAAIAGLIEKIQATGCQASLNILLLNFSDMCINISRRYQGRFESDDIYQQCMESMIKAAKAYQIDCGHDFSGFAYCLVLREVSLFCIKQWNVVTPPKTKGYYKAFRKVSKLKAEEPMCQRRAEQMAGEIGVSIEDILTAHALLTRSASLDATAENGGSLIDTLVDPTETEQLVIDDNERHVRSEKLNVALSKLTDRQRKVISIRRLSEDEDRLTLQEVGEMLGVSHERVRQIELEAISKMQKAVA